MQCIQHRFRNNIRIVCIHALILVHTDAENGQANILLYASRWCVPTGRVRKRNRRKHTVSVQKSQSHCYSAEVVGGTASSISRSWPCNAFSSKSLGLLASTRVVLMFRGSPPARFQPASPGCAAEPEEKPAQCLRE